MVKLKLDIPEEFYNEEVRCGYRVSHEMKKLWAVELDLLAEFIRVCDENGFEYYAYAGTLLGAVRHKGFIPWDNDIDIVMTRDEYERFCTIAPTLFKSPYFFQTNITDPGSMRGHAQLRNSNTTMLLTNEISGRYSFNQGVFIDIFPMDRIPGDDKERENFFLEIRELRDKMQKHIDENGRASNPYFNQYEELSKKYNSDETLNIGEFIITGLKKDVKGLSQECLKDVVYLPFEMLSIRSVACYDELLRTWYGDYEQYVIGKDDHGDLFIDCDVSYREYLDPSNTDKCQILYDFEKEYKWKRDKEWQLQEHWRQLAELWQGYESLTTKIAQENESLREQLSHIENMGIIKLWKKLIRFKAKFRKGKRNV